MNKFKNILNDLTNGWAFLYTAIYGMISFFLGLYTIILNCCSNEHQNITIQTFFENQILFSICLTGIITIFSAIQIPLLNENNKFLNIRPLFFALLLCTFAHSLLDFSSGSGIYLIPFLMFGIPITFLFFIIPICILITLELKHKILLPKYQFKYKIFPLFFIFYNIICLTYFIWSIIKINFHV